MLLFLHMVGFNKNNKLIQMFHVTYSISLVLDPGFSIGFWSVVRGGHPPPNADGISKFLVGG